MRDVISGYGFYPSPVRAIPTKVVQYLWVLMALRVLRGAAETDGAAFLEEAGVDEWVG
jgi:hypothetical protein